MILLTTFAVACSSHSFRFSLNGNMLPIRPRKSGSTKFILKLIIGDGRQSSRTLQRRRSKFKEVTSLGPPGASRPTKEVKEMTKKELIAQCNSLVKKVARKQLAIEDLRKKKGVPNTADLGVQTLQSLRRAVYGCNRRRSPRQRGFQRSN